MTTEIFLADEEATLAFGQALARATFEDSNDVPDASKPGLGVKT